MSSKANIVVILGALLITTALFVNPSFSNLKDLIIKGKFSTKDLSTSSSPIEFIIIGFVVLIALSALANASDTIANITIISEVGLGIIELSNTKGLKLP